MGLAGSGRVVAEAARPLRFVAFCVFVLRSWFVIQAKFQARENWEQENYSESSEPAEPTEPTESAEDTEGTERTEGTESTEPAEDSEGTEGAG